MVKILTQEERDEQGLPDCFGTCLGGTECWEACGERPDKRYIKCLLQGKALIDSALEAELLEAEG